MPDKKIVYPSAVPSVQEYVEAFKKIESRLNDKQRQLLVIHHATPGRVSTATALAHSVGFANYRGTNLQYGKLGQMVGRELGIDYWAISLLVRFVRPGTVSNEQWLLVMRENVALALEQVGWVPSTSTLFFPEGKPDIPESDDGGEPLES